MNIKKILLALFIAVSGLPFALHAGELKIAVEPQPPEGCQTIQKKDYDVIDWSPVVKPQSNNQCGYKSAITGNVINKFLLGEIDKTVAKDALQDESSIAQSDEKESCDIDGDQLHDFAVNKLNIKPDRLTIMPTPFNVMNNSFKNGFTVQDLSVGAHDYGTPHIFVVKATEIEEQSQPLELKDLAKKMGHWVTCVVKENHQKRLQLHYADSLDETEKQRETIANAHALDADWLINSAEQVIREKQQIKNERRDATTKHLYNIIHGKYPSHSQQDSPASSYSLVSSLSSDNSLANRVRQSQIHKQQKSWFHRLTSYITPKKLMWTGFCAAGLWLLKTMLDNNNHGTTYQKMTA